MGGASAANAFGTSGTLVNPSAPAVRRTTEFQASGRRRGRVTLTGDVAERYQNEGISIGFWH